MANRTTGALNLPGLQRSVKKVTGKSTTTARKLSQATVESSASSAVQLKRKRVSNLEEEEDSPASKRIATERAVMETLGQLEKKFDVANENLQNCAKNEDLTAIEISIRDKVRENERRLNRIEAELKRTTGGVQQMVEDCVDSRVRQRIAELSSSGGSASIVSEQDRVEKIDCIEARKAIRMCPDGGNDEDELISECRQFIQKALEVPRDTAENLSITSVRKIRQARKSRVEDEILIKFGSIEERDVVQSYALNLGKQVQEGRRSGGGNRRTSP